MPACSTPPNYETSYAIEAIPSDEMVMRLIRDMPIAVLQVAKTHRMSLTRPSFSPSEYLAMLERQRLPKTVAFLREHESEV